MVPEIEIIAETPAPYRPNSLIKNGPNKRVIKAPIIKLTVIALVFSSTCNVFVIGEKTKSIVAVIRSRINSGPYPLYFST